ncbi:MAG: DUF6527 family protein [Oryzomonas sp.]|uniref:DUF6527 family protein n=1 Tax=Oryzomonas sp. TaxID=2855186 RepID=UPI002846795C|nr:DUF6527 family protein [Oryzomonas sp.]MDR3579207.1 DUF6527 family protein [Oryzomonas sp.]
MKRPKLSSISPRFVGVIPDQLEEGVLYICERYGTAIHKCCCGCGEEVVTPLSPADWAIRVIGETITLSPSIGNWSFACRSHYLIKNNQVIWAGTLTPGQIEQVKAQDRSDKELYIAAVNSQKCKENSIWSKLVSFFKKLLSF